MTSFHKPFLSLGYFKILLALYWSHCHIKDKKRPAALTGIPIEVLSCLRCLAYGFIDFNKLCVAKTFMNFI